MRERCELRICTVSEALRGTQQELEELRAEVGRSEKEGLEATRLAVMDEAGDVWYGAQCYMVAYREQCQQAVGAWVKKAKVADWSVSGVDLYRPCQGGSVVFFGDSCKGERMAGHSRRESRSDR